MEKRTPRRRFCLLILPCLLMMVLFLVVLQISFHLRVDLRDLEEFVDLPPHMVKESQTKSTSASLQQHIKPPIQNATLLQDDVWTAMVERARSMLQHCTRLLTNVTASAYNSTAYFNRTIMQQLEDNISMAELPAFGIIQAVTAWKSSSSSLSSSSPIPQEKSASQSNLNWQCEMPPETECQETKLTAIYMGHNEDRLKYLVSNIRQKVTEADWHSLIEKVILVYNGPPNDFVQYDMGRRLVNLSKTFPDRFEIFPVLEHDGFSNHLMNRYHPSLNVTTKGMIFYDDDGPFLTFNATFAAFELWKRHAQAQVGALGRTLDLSPRQAIEKKALQKQRANHGQDDRFFVSQCPGPIGVGGSMDRIEYNFEIFPNFGANMVLPSNTFMHSNYRCFLWHPMLQELRHFVATHPVYPDDLLVSMVVSQLSGQAPRIYSRRFRPIRKKKLKVLANSSMAQPPNTTLALQTMAVNNNNNDSRNVPSLPATSRRRRLVGSTFQYDSVLSKRSLDKEVFDPNSLTKSTQRHHRARRLLWKEASSEEVWADRRSHAANMIASYFGSLNSGSLGWCAGTRYYQARMDTCEPFLAEVGMLPWMQPDNSPKTTCP